MINPTDPFEAGLRVARAFEDHGISYALGGAPACGLWGIPRATIDVDVNVFVTEEGLPAVFAARRSLFVPRISWTFNTFSLCRDGVSMSDTSDGTWCI
jgi:hypothetical protein